MKRNNFWKWVLVAFIVVWSLWEINPPTSRDLVEEFKRRAINTDTNFTAILDRVQQLQQQAPGRAFQSLLEATGTNNLSRYFPFVNTTVEDDPNLAVLHRLQRRT